MNVNSKNVWTYLPILTGAVGVMALASALWQPYGLAQTEGVIMRWGFYGGWTMLGKILPGPVEFVSANFGWYSGSRLNEDSSVFFYYLIFLCFHFSVLVASVGLVLKGPSGHRGPVILLGLLFNPFVSVDLPEGTIPLILELLGGLYFLYLANRIFEKP